VNKRLIIGAISIMILLGLAVFLAGRKRPAASSARTANTASSAVLSSQAAELLKKDELPQAKALYQRLIIEFPNSNEALNWQKKAEEINLKLLFSPVLTPKSALYEIKPGDALEKIAKNFKTTSELIMKSNNLKSDKILPGRKIKVWTAPFNIVVDKSQNLLILKSEEEIIKTYVISTGLNNSTPVGNFKVVNKLPNPTWFKAGAVVPADSSENILGSRWMGFDLPGYGIHGTTDPGNLGKQVTQGCVRMSNPEVEELYAIIPVGTEVTIVD